MRFFPDIYQMDETEIYRIQDRLLRETVSRVAEESPYYRSRFRDAGISPSRFRGLDELSSLPLTSRDDLQAHFKDFLAVSPDRIFEIVATTGTTGEPIYFYLTGNDLERLAENERRGFSWAGISPGDRVCIAVTLDNLFIAGLAYHLGLRKIGATSLRVGAQPAKRHLDILRQNRPVGIVAVPSLLLALARQAMEDGEDIASYAPRKAILIGDSIRSSDLLSNSLGRRVEEAWGGEIISTYGLSEVSLAFHECPARRGLHAHPDLILPEVVDEEGKPVNDGTPGELVLTPLQVEGMPLIRYRTGDVTFLVSGFCPCGRKGARIGPILGRKQQRLKVKGTTLYPKTIEDALFGISEIDNYYVEVVTDEDETDKVILTIGTRSKKSFIGPRIIDSIYSKARVTPEIRVRSPREVDKVLYEGGRRKPRTFLDLRKSPRSEK